MATLVAATSLTVNRRTFSSVDPKFAGHSDARVGGRGRIGLSGGEGQTFWAVRRQRLHALTFEILPSVTSVVR